MRGRNRSVESIISKDQAHRPEYHYKKFKKKVGRNLQNSNSQLSRLMIIISWLCLLDPQRIFKSVKQWQHPLLLKTYRSTMSYRGRFSELKLQPTTSDIIPRLKLSSPASLSRLPGRVKGQLYRTLTARIWPLRIICGSQRRQSWIMSQHKSLTLVYTNPLSKSGRWRKLPEKRLQQRISWTKLITLSASSLSMQESKEINGSSIWRGKVSGQLPKKSDRKGNLIWIRLAYIKD